MIGDGEAETGPLAASWHANKFINPVRDGAVLPILHLNGYKIANPTVLSRISEDELSALMYGYGYDVYFVEGDDPAQVHQALARTLHTMVLKIREVQHTARQPWRAEAPERPLWPMLVLRTPKAGPARRLSMAIGSRARGAPIKCHWPALNSRLTCSNLRIG